jgi:hypothetical protein
MEGDQNDETFESRVQSKKSADEGAAADGRKDRRGGGAKPGWVEIARWRRDEFTAHCSSCDSQQSFKRRRIRHALHLLGAILTAGLWSIGWIAISIETALRPWRCRMCGWHKPEFRMPLKEALRMGETALRRRNPQREIEEGEGLEANSPMTQ